MTSEIDSVRWYDGHAEEYIGNTVDADVRHLYSAFLAQIPAGGRILDAGCGSGRDSLAFQRLGYDITAIDGSSEMARHASLLLGIEVLVLRHQEIAFASEFDGVWSMASLLHVLPVEMPKVLANYRDALVLGGVLFVSFKHGSGVTVTSERTFTNHDQTSFAELIDQVEGLSILSTSIDPDTRPGRSDESWFSAICRRDLTV